MTLDGRIASRTGSSQWISGEESRAIAHTLRSRVDAILVGRGTAEADDPLLTARLPEGTPARVALRVVLDSQASLSLESQLIQTIADAPVMVVAHGDAPKSNRDRLLEKGCEILTYPSDDPHERVRFILEELGKRQMTNVLVEGGAGVLGSFFDADEIDEVHAFIASKLIGGTEAFSPIGGSGIADMNAARELHGLTSEPVGEDIYLRGRINRSP